jgi:hypothetical protein
MNTCFSRQTWFYHTNKAYKDNISSHPSIPDCENVWAWDVTIVWDENLYSDVDRPWYGRFGRNCCLKIQGSKAAYFRETFVPACYTTRHNIPEDRYIDPRHGELLISHFVGFLFSRIATKSNHEEVKCRITTPLAMTYSWCCFTPEVAPVVVADISQDRLGVRAVSGPRYTSIQCHCLTWVCSHIQDD